MMQTLPESSEVVVTFKKVFKKEPLNRRKRMTNQSKGLLWLGGGFCALLIVFGFIVQGAFLLLGLWMIDRGLRLRGSRPLHERIVVWYLRSRETL